MTDLNLRIRLRPTDRSDVMCVECLKFQADHVLVRRDGTETDSGIHRKCSVAVHAKFTRKRRSP